jgi:alkaline phosphatase D
LKALGKPNAEGGGLFVNPDQWDGYPPARERLFDQIAAAGNVVVLTGDIHSAWANDLARDPNNPDIASGGYDASTGAGALGVEFVATSISSPGLDDPDGVITGLVHSQNPHVRHLDFNHRGYLLLDLTPARVACEYWSVATVQQRDPAQTLHAVLEVQHGRPHLLASTPTTPPADPPPPAP